MKFLLKDICKIDRKDLTLYSLYPEQGSYISWEDLFTQFNIELSEYINLSDVLEACAVDNAYLILFELGKYDDYVKLLVNISEMLLPIFEEGWENQKRLSQYIDQFRQYAYGEISKKKLDVLGKDLESFYYETWSTVGDIPADVAGVAATRRAILKLLLKVFLEDYKRGIN